MRRHLLILIVIVVAFGTSRAHAHDIPNARVDRSIQATVEPGRLRIDYEVGLAELTLTQDLRALVGSLPGADRREWFEQYGQVSSPLNARGLLVSVDGRPLELRSRGFDLTVEDHPRYLFHFEADLPPRGRLAIQDTNYAASEGTSRLALRGLAGVLIRGDDQPGDVTLIPIRPVWQMTDAEERRTRQLEVEFEPKEGRAAKAPHVPAPATSVGPRPSGPAEGLSRLLDRSAVSGLGLWLIALSLGAAHAIQPGHGKSLVAAASIGDRGGWPRGVALALVITLAHIGGVLAVAIALWATRSSRYPDINLGLARGAGIVIASIGLWRLGRHLGGYGEHDEDSGPESAAPGVPGLISLGLAGGVVPCWDAVVLILLAEAVGRLPLGLALLSAFSLGMAAVLVAVGVTAAQLRGFLERRDRDKAWVRRLGLLSASAITTIGLYLVLS
jgi:ABC-type nickel/cobalt efflux system permease component RcnA